LALIGRFGHACAMNGTQPTRTAFIGFGEAAQTFAAGGRFAGYARAFDIKRDDPAIVQAMQHHQIAHCANPVQALEGAGAVLSLVTADQAVIAATQCAPHLLPGAVYFEMNSVAPETKIETARHVEAAGGHPIDVAIMAPVYPAGIDVPLLISGGEAQRGMARLEALGFTNVRIVGAKVGQAAAIKMVRSVIIKGMEALTAEAVLAGCKAGVLSEVLRSLGPDWEDKANYQLERIMVHGLRRAAEMEEAAKTLRDLSVSPKMTEGTIARQREIGQLGLRTPPETLTDKIEAILDGLKGGG